MENHNFDEEFSVMPLEDDQKCENVISSFIIPFNEESRDLPLLFHFILSVEEFTLQPGLKVIKLPKDEFCTRTRLHVSSPLQSLLFLYLKYGFVP